MSSDERHSGEREEGTGQEEIWEGAGTQRERMKEKADIYWEPPCPSPPSSFLDLTKALEALKWSEVKVAQSCPTLCNPIDYTVCGILQARILEWVAFPFSRGSSQPRSPALRADSLPTELSGKPLEALGTDKQNYQYNVAKLQQNSEFCLCFKNIHYFK